MMADVVIVGGGAIGAAVACWLKAEEGFPGSVLVVERDPTYATASTALSAASIRQQFSTPLNIALSRFGLEMIRDFPRRMATTDGPGPDLGLKENGYLFLAATESQEAALREVHAVQTAEGAEVALVTPDEIAARLPHLRLDDIRLGSLGLSGEGWFDNMGLLGGFRARARAAGAEFVHDEVLGLEREGDRIAAVTLRDRGRVPCGIAVNAAGARAGVLAATAGLSLPIGPRKRTLFVVDCPRRPEGRLPLVIDADGVFHRPEGAGLLCGTSPEDDPEVAFDDFEPRHAEFEDEIWPSMAARCEAFEALKVRRMWAGHYEWCALDHNGVVGRHPEVPNLIVAAGFSGHGLQHSSGVGRGVAELIARGGYASLDLSPLGVERILENRPLLETAII